MFLLYTIQIYSFYIQIPSISRYLWIGVAKEPHAGPIFSAAPIKITVFHNSPTESYIIERQTNVPFCVDQKMYTLTVDPNCPNRNQAFTIIRDISGFFRIMQEEKCLEYVKKLNMFLMRKCTMKNTQVFDFAEEDESKS